MNYPARILKVSYRSATTGRQVRTYAKVPYSGMYGLSETLVRAVSTNQISSYTVKVATAAEIGRVRNNLQRWPEALAATSERSGVTWNS